MTTITSFADAATRTHFLRKTDAMIPINAMIANAIV